MLLSGEQMCTGTETQGSCWGLQMACVSSVLGTYGPCQEGGCSAGDGTWSMAFFPTGRMLHPFVSCCPMAKLLLAEEFWLGGVAGARNYLPGKNPIPRSPGWRQG